jgi:hypothetical protein
VKKQIPSIFLTFIALFGYRDGSGVAYVLRRLEAEAGQNAALTEKLQQARQVIYSL